MAVAAPVPELTYRYPFPSALVTDGNDRLRLATSGGPDAHPRFFRGQLLVPDVAADLLLSLGDVARSRFHVPPAMLARILQLADPVVTCADDRLRFEAFSACCSVYGRADLLPDGFDGEIVGRGTTNVDFGSGIRTALSGIEPRSRLGLSVGAEAVEVDADGTTAIERRVLLPQRWLRGFLEVQAIQAEMAGSPVAQVGAAEARAFIRSIPKGISRRPVWVVAAGRGLRIAHHDPGGGAAAVAGVARLRLLERAMRHATTLRVFALPGEGSSGWQLDVPGGRLTVVLSPDVWRGFSGEGRALHRLASDVPPAAVAAVRGALGWEGNLATPALAAASRQPAELVDRALAALALSGVVGFDLAAGTYFRRELPFDLGRREGLQPRLRDARRLVEARVVRIDATESGLGGWVAGSGGVEHRVRQTETGWACTCPWYGRHRGDRGPCKHVLAVQLAATDDAG